MTVPRLFYAAHFVVVGIMEKKVVPLGRNALLIVTDNDKGEAASTHPTITAGY